VLADLSPLFAYLRIISLSISSRGLPYVRYESSFSLSTFPLEPSGGGSVSIERVEITVAAVIHLLLLVLYNLLFQEI
jgi:hypothetical protein